MKWFNRRIKSINHQINRKILLRHCSMVIYIRNLKSRRHFRSYFNIIKTNGHHIIMKYRHIITKDRHMIMKDHHIITKDHHIITKDHHIITKDHHIITKDHHIIMKDHHIITKAYHIIIKDHHIITKDHHIIMKDHKAVMACHSFQWYITFHVSFKQIYTHIFASNDKHFKSKYGLIIITITNLYIFMFVNL